MLYAITITDREEMPHLRRGKPGMTKDDTVTIAGAANVILRGQFIRLN